MSSLPFRLMLITDWRREQRVWSALDALVAQLGPRLADVAIQHRGPELTARRTWQLAEALARRLEGAPVALFVNARLDLALGLKWHLHLPSAAIAPHEARAHLGGRWLSAAVHSPEEARAAAGWIDLALVSPVYAPRSKGSDSRPPLGVPGFQRIAALLPCPSFALGGVTANRAAGLNSGVATVSEWLEPDGAARVEALLGATAQGSASAPLGSSTPVRS